MINTNILRRDAGNGNLSNLIRHAELCADELDLKYKEIENLNNKILELEKVIKTKEVEK